MDYESVRAYCLSKVEVTEGYPFGEGTLVFKVAGRMFVLVAEDNEPLSMNLKCDPEDALALRDQYAAIEPGYHMDKKHWNTLVLDGSLSDGLVQELIDHSYDLVVRKLKVVDRERILKRMKK
ncbi:MAG: MmcQ/YjbR family DNA-binding protein [Anaerolineales bacterium]|nr:MmcQ/YjbR family DNA-binding protein [Anaerolineales bacterium]